MLVRMRTGGEAWRAHVAAHDAHAALGRVAAVAVAAAATLLADRDAHRGRVAAEDARLGLLILLEDVHAHNLAAECTLAIAAALVVVGVLGGALAAEPADGGVALRARRRAGHAGPQSGERQRPIDSTFFFSVLGGAPRILWLDGADDRRMICFLALADDSARSARGGR